MNSNLDPSSLLSEFAAFLPQTDLLVLDRGYPSNALAAVLTQSQRHFCWRVDATGWTCVRQFLRSGRPEAVVTLAAARAADATTYAVQRTPTTVRLIRDVTPSGTVRVLMTSLLDVERYPAASFGALYHRRWRVEEAFKRLKHRLRLEAPTGLTHLAFQQDFAAKIPADNLQAILAAVPATEPNETPVHRPNRTYAIGTLKPILAGCLLRLSHCLCALPRALEAITRARCRVQPNRAYPRPPGNKPHLHLSYGISEQVLASNFAVLSINDLQARRQEIWTRSDIPYKLAPDYPSVASSFREWPEMAIPEGWESSQIWLTAAASGHLMRIRGSEDATCG